MEKTARSRSPSPFPSHPGVPAPALSLADVEPSPCTTSDAGGKDERCPCRAACFGVPPCSTTYPRAMLRVFPCSKSFPMALPGPCSESLPGASHTSSRATPAPPPVPQKDLSMGLDVRSLTQLCWTLAPAWQRWHRGHSAGLRAFLRDKAERCQHLFAFNHLLLLRGTCVHLQAHGGTMWAQR